MIAIEKNIPRTKKPHQAGRGRLYPFHEMEIGDSFFAEADNPFGKQQSILGSARQRRIPGKKFSTEIVNGGVRCWRVK